MATTKIWDIRGRLDRVVDYAKNPDKTKNKNYGEADLQALRDVMDYVSQDVKTEKQFYVTGLNCSPETAREEMTITKKQYRKEGGIIAYHAYQSFKPGEVSPEIAHEIGVKLAEELWGSRFEVIVATHIDKAHIHNHMVLNSVSFSDGLRYYDNKETYRKMREVSDRLCLEYRLSVIEKTMNKSMQYGEWRAEQEGKPTWRGLILKDLDTTISESVTLRQFLYRLRQKGYAIKYDAKYFTLKPPGKARYVRIDRKYPEYSLTNIEQRIFEQQQIKQYRPGPKAAKKKMLLHGSLEKARHTSGLRGLYLYYCFKLGVFQKKKDREASALPFLYREDIRKMEQISQEARFLCHHQISTMEELESHKAGSEQQIKRLCTERKKLWNRTQRTPDEKEVTKIKADIAGLSAQIKTLRKEVKYCDGIAARSISMREKIKVVKLEEKNNAKEKSKNEHKR